MSDNLDIETPNWPPDIYRSRDSLERWLTFQKEYPGSDAPSRSIRHVSVPFRATISTDRIDAEALGRVAATYLRLLQDYLVEQDIRGGIGLPESWEAQLFPRDSAPNGEILKWLDVWPPVGEGVDGRPPKLASWNMSRDTDTHELPATIMLVASETLPDLPDRLVNPNIGLRLPIAVAPRESGGFEATIRSMSAELPREGFASYSDVYGPRFDRKVDLFDVQEVVGFLDTQVYSVLREQVSKEDEPDQEVSVITGAAFRVTRQGETAIPEALRVFSTVRGRAPRKGAGTELSFAVETDFDANFEPIRSERHPLVTHALPPDARVFVQTPPGWVDQGAPLQDYTYTDRRPARDDDVLEDYLVERPFGGDDPKKLEEDGFEIILSELVAADREAKKNGGSVKEIPASVLGDLPPRRNDFTALNAYYHASDFFQMMKAFGLVPQTFVVRAQTKIQIDYRAGITPGPGGDGRTINAQVRINQTEDDPDPIILINLALANLNRWSRPLQADGTRSWAEPLGIGDSGRWMLHEFGHYVLAARLGQLELDFCHSAGDGMAAVAFDPISRLADPREGVSTRFRGVTYPFVFATRRHDRTPLLGWAWYGALNRSILESPPSDPHVTKGYLTEQILSSTLFRLYRALGGDTLMDGDPEAGPHAAVRARASFVTLFLLLRGMTSFAQSPTTPEMLEEAMETIDTQMMQDLLIVDYRDIAGGFPAQDVAWRGGMAHKVVRWAFEAQGMFPEDPAITLNNVGRPPAVDIYIGDGRPNSEMTNTGPIQYGPGSYDPVSLDWGPEPKWMMPKGAISIGNRGHLVAQQIQLRAWLGTFNTAPGAPDWEDQDVIDWTEEIGTLGLADIDGGDVLDDVPDDLSDVLASPPAGADLLLIEISCPGDEANTDPAAGYAVAVSGGGAFVSDLPKSPRGLADLVANDNNLGLTRLT